MLSSCSCLSNTFSTKTVAYCMITDKNGKLITCGCRDGRIRRFERQTGKLIAKLKCDYEQIRTLSQCPENNYLASGSDGKIRIWDLQQLKQVGKAMTCHTTNNITLCYSPNGQYLASSFDNNILIWDMKGDKKMRCLHSYKSEVYTIDYSSNGKLIASGGFDPVIRLWNTETRHELKYSLKGHIYSVHSLKFSEDSKNLISGGSDKLIILWDVQNGKILKQFHGGHTSFIQSIIYSAQEQFIISGSADKSIRVWNINSGECQIVKGHNSHVNSLSITLDDKYLISAGCDSLVRVQRIQFE